ncbi:MAG TPA: DUF4340 domain-containing protein [Opitutaceae bacterium]|jgi:hypothetical protein
MRSKVTLVLLFLNVALFFFIFYFERDWRIEQASREARRRVLGPEASDIRRLEVTVAAPGSSFTLERRNDVWYLTKPVEWPANPNAVSRILNELQFLEHETSFPTRDLEKNGQKLSDYGLDQPKLIVSFTSGEASGPGAPAGRTTVLRIGDTTEVGNHLYLLSPDGERIHVVGRQLADSLSIPLDQLRSDTVFSIPVFEARSLSLQIGAPSGVRVRLHRDASRWSFETPVIARAAKNATELAINGLDALRVKAFILQNPPAVAPSAAPALRVTIEGNNRHETLYVGGPADGDQTYYAQLEDRPAIFTVAIVKPLMDTLRNAGEDLRDRHVLDFDANAVTSIALSAPNQTELDLQRLESAAANQAPGWQILRRGSGVPGPQALPADSAAVQRLLDQLETLTALKFESDAPTNAELEDWGFNRPEREIALTLAGANQVTLQIGLPSKRENVAYARIAGSSSVYAVEPDILRETKASPLAWREKVLATIPASGKITSLTLANASDNSVIYSKTLTDGQTWEAALTGEPAPKKAALETLLAQLRLLRASSFIAEGFPEKVLAAGEVRPWRYRLDATISLPGGNGSGQVSKMTLWFAERSGGSEQLAGSREIGAVFAIEQPLLDALWTLTQP